MTLVLVPTEGQVEVCALRGERAITRYALREKLLRALAPDVVFAEAMVVRAALASAMAEEPSFDRLRALGGAAWENTVDAMLETLRAVRCCNLEGTLSALAAGIDARLGDQVDPARLGLVLAQAIEREPARAKTIVGDSIVSRWIVRWDPGDVVWWRALSRIVATSIELPWIDRPLDAERAAGPLERIMDDVALLTAEPPIPRLLEAVPLEAGDAEIISISACSDAESQARATASAISTALAQGAAIDRVAVVCVDPDEEVLAPVRRVLEEIETPFHDAVGIAPAASGIVAVALDAFSLSTRGLPRVGVAALLRSRYLDAVLVTGIQSQWAARRALDDLARTLESTPTAGGDDPVLRLEATAGSPLARRVGEILLTRARTRAEHVAASRHVLRALGFDPSIARDDLRSSARDAQGFEALLDALERASNDMECSAHTFLHELRMALARPAAASAAGRAGALRLARPIDVAGAPLDLLVVLDCSDESLDRPRSIVGPLLSEATLARLRQRQADRAPRDLVREQRLAELALAAEHAKRIVLCHRTRGPSGEELAPALIVRTAHERGAPREVVRAGDRPRTEREHRLALVAAATPEVGLAIAPSAVYRAMIEASREAWHGGRDDDRTRLAAGLVEGAALATLRNETGIARAMSVTLLERFARCAFQGYAAMLAASGEEITRETPDAREEGNLVHEALRVAFEAIKDLDAEEDELVARAIAAVDAAVRSSHASTLRNVALVRAKNEVEQVVRAYARDVVWQFAFAEKSFGRGEEGGWPELVLGDVRLRGTMDRVDVAKGDPSHIRVIDYKRRQDHASPSELGKHRLQLLVYGVIAARELKAQRFDGLYLPTRAPHEPPPVRWAEAWKEFASEAATTARVLEVLAPVRAGEVLPAPGSACMSCAFDGACRKPRFAIAEGNATGDGGA